MECILEYGKLKKEDSGSREEVCKRVLKVLGGKRRNPTRLQGQEFGQLA